VEYDFITSNLVVTIVECHVSQGEGEREGGGRGEGEKGGEWGENEGKGEGLKKGPIVLTASVLAHEMGLKQGNKYIAVLIITCTVHSVLCIQCKSLPYTEYGMYIVE
jgi:hypothetical protein